MNELERLERATQTPEYQVTAGLVGAALAGAFMLPKGPEQDAAVQRAAELQQKLVDLVRRG